MFTKAAGRVRKDGLEGEFWVAYTANVGVHAPKVVKKFVESLKKEE